MSIKLPLMTKAEMQDLMKIDGVCLLNQSNDLAAKQEREKGFCECITAKCPVKFPATPKQGI